MIYFFGSKTASLYAVQCINELLPDDISKLQYLFDGVPLLDQQEIIGLYEGPRAALISPWSSNVVELTQQIGIKNVQRLEQFRAISDSEKNKVDLMLYEIYTRLHQDMFTLSTAPEKILNIEDISAYNVQEGLSLSDEEVIYLEELSKKYNRKLTDAEVFGFSQVNSEHCRHKIFNGTFIIDGKEMPSSLFKLIKKTSQKNPESIVSAYMDNVAFVKGSKVIQFAPSRADIPSLFDTKEFQSVISMKAETHNYPTTVEPFNGASTGSGGEVRDRMAGGQGSVPLAGTAVYMTSYPRVNGGRSWEKAFAARKWLYQSPEDILVKAAKGAADFGSKHGQPLITGSILTFEHQEDERKLGYDKVIMMAGGVGYAKKEQAMKLPPQKGDKIIVMGGENYRIGMGGAAVSSVDTGAMDSLLDLNAVQRSNPVVQKAVANTVRAVVEGEQNIITSIHDHGAGGHFNCFSELVENTGGHINLDKLPVGDPTLSAKEIVGNESQERMGLIIPEKDLPKLEQIASRERATLYVVGDVTDDHVFKIESAATGEKPLDFQLEDLFGSSPKTIMEDQTLNRTYQDLEYQESLFEKYLEEVLQLEAVACKDWLLNKSDRSVTGLVAKQSSAGPLQLPLNNCGVMALSFLNKEGIATSLGHAPAAALIDEAAGSRLAIAEALTNIIWAPLDQKIKSVSLSANWMWPCRDKGEDARLYRAVEACSDFAIELGINIPTGKDSLSMKQKYENDEVIAPGTVIISAAGPCSDITKVVEPVLKKNSHAIYYINLSHDSYNLGGSSFAQTLNKVGSQSPDIKDADKFAQIFNTIQDLISDRKIDAGHDIASGGLITTLLEMCFADQNLGADIDLSDLGESDVIKLLFSENTGIVFQGNSVLEQTLSDTGIEFYKIGSVRTDDKLALKNQSWEKTLKVSQWRDIWYKTSYIHEQSFVEKEFAQKRFDHFKKQPLAYTFPANFSGQVNQSDSNRPLAAILREKGSHSERETAYALYLAGFDVLDVHMTDLITGRENLKKVQFLAIVGGATHSNVFGAAKGWAAAFKYNAKALEAITNFYNRPDTLSIGIGNGGQLLMELGLLFPNQAEKPRIQTNESQVFESIFSTIRIEENHSIMFSSLVGSVMGAWSSNLEGKFLLPDPEGQYHITGKYAYSEYPANPYGSDYETAILSDSTGRHIITMAHIERGVLPWQWPYYPEERKDEAAPWLTAFENARLWLNQNSKE